MTKLPDFHVYRGDGIGLQSALEPQTFSVGQGHGKYLAEPALIDAVNVAIAVGQPLLVTGDPGVGKTQLAWSIATELGLDGPFVFHTKSTSVAKDLLYRYDAVGRFHDIQVQPRESQVQAPDADTPTRRNDAEPYIHTDALGKAIELAEKNGKRSVVLIDEIDKAPRDFANDLLHEIDAMAFEIRELGNKKYEAPSSLRPIVVITSNNERGLPLPFLRRCVFFEIAFPEEKLSNIIAERLGPLKLDKALVDTAIEKFLAVRALDLDKKPSTGEMLAWIHALAARKTKASDLIVPLSELPALQILIKSKRDRQLLLGT